MLKLALICCLTFLGLNLPAADEGTSLLGTRPPPWNVTNWLNSPPLDLEKLRGKVVLIRWWTAPHCPYCRASAPALNEFHEKFFKDGLRVIGLYHHKSDEPLRLTEVKRYSQKYKFVFPIAIDPEWRTLRNWWLNQEGSQWTSVSFLIDRNGIIRHIHPGGQYVKGDVAYDVLQKKIQELLAEK